MQLSQEFMAFAGFAAEIMFWSLLSLNIASFAIIAERVSFFWRRRLDADQVARHVLHFTRLGDYGRARNVLLLHRAPECTVLLAGLGEIAFGRDAVRDAMRSALARERIRMETNLTMLRAVAWVSPGLGLMGTLFGVVSTLPQSSVPLLNPQGLLSGPVREAIGALAVLAAGLAVAVPAVLSLVLFDRRVRMSVERSESLSHLFLAAVERAEATAAEAAEKQAEAPPPEVAVDVAAEKPALIKPLVNKAA